MTRYPSALLSQPVTAKLSRRAFLFGGVSLIGITALTGRLYYLQFIRSEKYRTLAEGNRIKVQVLPPQRGIIYDRTGRPLAENRKNFRLMLDTEKNRNARESLEKLPSIVTLTESEMQTARTALTSRRFGPPILIKEEMAWDDVVKVEYQAPDLPGVFIEVGQSRHYPLGEDAAHVLGYVAAVNEKEKKANNDSYRWPNATIGKQGIEKSWENELRGSPGWRHMEVNVRGLAIRELERNAGIPGEDIHSALHYDLQSYCYQTLFAKLSGAAIVMDIRNGEVLALASAPSFNSNVMAAGISTKEWNALQQDEKIPLMDKALAGQYPPGSTFKMVVGLAAMRAGTANPYSTVYCPGHYYLGRHRFNCWRPGGHGTVDLKRALAESCDTYFYTMGQKTGIQPIADTARMLGLGRPTGLDIPGEKGGIIPDPEWKRRAFNQPWHTGDTVNAAIGQGYVLTTPMQLCLMVAHLANGGVHIQPTLKKTDPAVQRQADRLDVDPEHLKAVLAGMDAVINAPNGTAYGSRIQQPEFAFAGKTGTSQVRRITVRGQDQNRIPWRFRHHGLFVGYAPVFEPRYACAVIVEHGGGGASAAAPVVRDILLKTQQLMTIPAPEKSA